jgi:hypothetical protein
VLNPVGKFVAVADSDGNGQACYTPADKTIKCAIRAVETSWQDGGQTAGRFEWTGSQCSGTADGAENGTDVEKKCETVNGRQVCSVPGEPSCITVLGEKVCQSAAGGVCLAGDCINGTVGPESPDTDKIDTPTGARITRPDAPLPPRPNNGTPGVPASPDGKIDARHGVGGGGYGNNYYSYYSPATVAGSDEGGEGECEEGEHMEGGECVPDDGECVDDPETEENECGSGGPAGCNGDEPGKVCIDETGVPEDAPEGLNDDDLKSALDDLDAKLEEYQPLAPERPNPGLWSTSACQSVTWTFLHSESRQFPGDACPQIDQVRNVAGWLLMMVAGWFLGRRVIREL